MQEVREIGTSAVVEGLAYVENAIIQFIARHLNEAMDHGEIAQCDAEVVAFIMLRTYTALVVEWEQRHAPLSDDAIRETFHQLFAVGLKTDASLRGQ